MATIPNLARYLFLDIETTGVLPSKSKIYLVGLGEYTHCPNEKPCIKLEQYLLESLSDERQFLDILSKRCEHILGFLSYNGQQFDLRFLQECADAYHMDLNLFHKNNIDWIHYVKKFRHIFGFSSAKQKAIEKIFGFHRTGRLEKTELIALYQQYLQHKDAKLLSILLSHQQEDFISQSHLFPLLYLNEFFMGHFDYVEMSFSEAALPDTASLEEMSSKMVFHASASSTNFIGSADSVDFIAPTKNRYLRMYFKSSQIFPAELSFPLSKQRGMTSHFQGTKDVLLTIKEQSLILTFPIIYGRFLYDLPNYKDYDYLLTEQTILHRSLSAYVSKSNKRRAKKEECFLAKESEFIPCFALPQRKHYKDEHREGGYLELSDVLQQEEAAMQILNTILKLFT